MHVSDVKGGGAEEERVNGDGVDKSNGLTATKHQSVRVCVAVWGSPCAGGLLEHALRCVAFACPRVWRRRGGLVSHGTEDGTVTARGFLSFPTSTSTSPAPTSI
jgi:hypothetical protein